MGPDRADLWKMRLQLFQGMLGELPEGRDLAAEDRQERRDAALVVQLQDIITRDRRGAG